LTQLTYDNMNRIEVAERWMRLAFRGQSQSQASIETLGYLILGAWSNYLIGQYTQFSGVEPLAEGNIQFCGEHTSLNFQGFMEGRVTEGARAAQAI
jgi:hypothetical protein